MEQVYDYEKMNALTNELLSILTENKFSTEALALFMQKVNLSQSYFSGMAADAFRKTAKEAVLAFSQEDTKSILKLVKVAQMPRDNAEFMKIMDTIIADKVKNVLNKR